MSELIDREAVREFIKSYRHSTDVAFDMEKHLDEIHAAPRWHRVEEPPKYTSRYVVWCGVNWYGEGMHGDFMTANYNTVSGRWSVDCDRAINGPLIGDILYWMPIEPPTGTERSET